MLRHLTLLIVILLSGTKLFSQVDHWETAVFETDIWNYLVPSSAVDPAWNDVGFNTTGWSTGQGGFGYGDGDDQTVLPNGTISCFQRIEFNVVDTSNIFIAALTIDYDDAFVAYLNGVEITRDLLAGTGQPTWDQQASGLHEALAYQGAYPAQYTISKSFLSANLNQGVNVLAVQTHNESATSSDMSSRVFLHFGISNTSNNYSPVPNWFVPPFVFTSSNLPIVVINTVGNITVPDEPKIDAIMGIIYNGEGNLNYINDPYNEYYGNIGIERRGSSSQSFPKKPYAIETRGPDSSNYNVSLFDWPADNDYALIAPYSDKSLIRNVLTYKLGSELGRWAPRTKLCELVLNGEYVGVYVLTEKIKQTPGRVNINELEYSDTVNNEITGGYIVKIDKTTGGGVIAWTSPFTAASPATGPIYYQMHDPDLDTLHPLQLNYIQQYITDFEVALDGPNYTDPVLGYEPYIDVNSFVDFMIMNEISKNVDGYRISTFYHKQHIHEGGKLVAGPLWDFNLGWGNANYCDGGLTTGWEIYFNDVCGGGGSLNNPFHWNKLVTDPEFTHKLNCRWQELRQDELHADSILAFIDAQAIYLTDAAGRNFTKWNTLGSYVWPNNYVGNTYLEEIDYLKTWTVDRINWMDANMFGTCPDLGADVNEYQFLIYPNPTNNSISVKSDNLLQNGMIELTDLTGKRLLYMAFAGKAEMILDLSDYESGIYLINIYENNRIVSHEKIIRL
ncbi:MAG: CotH kinase family protein [Crocinitomicaceae bacterium]|nr:CotH kinase family protein [Crocinitomicaceae bacterium]